MENRLTRKALSLLTSPPSLAAMAMLLVNDHMLRRFWPSWVTGKLGDFAWLFFFPFAMAWGWSLLLPRREGWVRGLAFGVTGGIFALVKTIPACHAVVVGVAGWMMGWPVGWVRDPTDLVALVSLAAGWVMWGRDGLYPRATSTGMLKRPPSQTGTFGASGLPRHALSGRALWGRLALAAAALLTVANMARLPSIGVRHLTLHDGAIYSLEWDVGYVSHDGGLSWMPLEVTYDTKGQEDVYSEDGETWIGVSELCAECVEAINSDRNEVDTTIRILKVDDMVQYRFASGSPADKTYFERLHWFYDFHPGPLHAVADLETGNVVFAMGAEGVLVRTPSGAWTWGAVGPARRVELRRGEELLFVSQGWMLLAAGFGLLAIMTLFSHWCRGLARKIFLGFCWLLWGANVVLMPSVTNYERQMDTLAMAAGCIYLLIHIGIELALALPKQATVGQVGRVALVGLAGTVLFFAPYVLWVLGVVPWYGLAVFLALGLGAGVIMTGWRWTGAHHSADLTAA